MLNWLQRILPSGAKSRAMPGANAEAALARGEHFRAEALYRKALEDEPANPSFQLGLGYALLGLNQAEEALQAARRALELAPDYRDARRWLAWNLYALGRQGEAAVVLDQGLACHPADADLLELRAAVHSAEGQDGAAADLYQEVLALKPSHASALSGFGMLELKRNNVPHALELLQRAVDLQPYSAPHLHHLGLALQAAGRYDEALACHRQSADVMPGFGSAHRNLAILLRERGALSEAIEHFRQALATFPGDADLLNRLAESLSASGNFSEAIETCRAILESETQNLEALVNLGRALQGMRRHTEAAEAYGRALEIAPENATIHFNLGTLHQAEGYFSSGQARREAFAAADRFYRAALAHEPRYIDALLCQASLSMADLRLEEALALLERALELEPEDADARTRRGQLALLMGDFDTGWRDCEYRFTQRGNKRLPPFNQPLWRNDFPLAGKTILLLAEQGMGDAIQFLRYVEPVALQSPAAILIEVHDALHPLLRTLPLPAHVPLRLLEAGKPFPDFDCFCPLMSLPYAFGTRIDAIPARIPYLSADPAGKDDWAARLEHEMPPRIGIVWSGSAELNNDFHRSIALERFAALLPPGLRVFSLQKDVREADAASLQALPNIVPLGAGLRDYGDTAALIANLDLVISVDTSVAHLAGAMGKPVWILLPFLPDYRWLTARSDSPWYPTARLFRQGEAGDWETVFAQVRQALDHLISPFTTAS